MKTRYLPEIQRLVGLLLEADIPFEYTCENTEFHELMNNQIKIKYSHNNEEGFLSVICHFGSYGAGRGLLEFYDFYFEPIGYLDADDCLDIIQRKLKEVE